MISESEANPGTKESIDITGVLEVEIRENTAHLLLHGENTHQDMAFFQYLTRVIKGRV